MVTDAGTIPRQPEVTDLSIAVWLRGRMRAALLGALVFILAGCATGQATRSASTSVTGGQTIIYVAFAPSTSYEAALGTISDMGLQLANLCQPLTTRRTDGSLLWAWWEPLGQHQHYDDQVPHLFVQPTPAAQGDWMARLRASVVVRDARGSQGDVVCPIVRYVEATPSPTENYTLPPDQVGTYAQLTFSSTDETYAAALSDVLNLGLRLADPCYESAAGSAAAWHPMGQEHRFAVSHTLLIATTPQTSTRWQEQVRALPSAPVIETTVHPACQTS
jgi:hypothetical protein